MTVGELIEKLQAMPNYWPMHIEQPIDGSGGGADKAYLYVLDCEAGNFPTHGGMAVIVPNPEPK